MYADNKQANFTTKLRWENTNSQTSKDENNILVKTT